MNNEERVQEYEDSYDQYFSFLDLERDPEWVLAWRAQDEAKVEELLYKYGANVKFGWRVDVCLHRPRFSNAVELGPKISFLQRQDKDWEEFLSIEDQIANTKDTFLRAELMGMNRRSNFSGDLIDKYGEEGDEVVC